MRLMRTRSDGYKVFFFLHSILLTHMPARHLVSHRVGRPAAAASSLGPLRQLPPPSLDPVEEEVARAELAFAAACGGGYLRSREGLRRRRPPWRISPAAVPAATSWGWISSGGTAEVRAPRPLFLFFIFYSFFNIFC